MSAQDTDPSGGDTSDADSFQDRYSSLLWQWLQDNWGRIVADDDPPTT